MAIVADLSGNGQIDKSFCTHNRTTAASPVGALTPEYVGEKVLDTVAGERWRAVGLGTGDWVLDTPDVTP